MNSNICEAWLENDYNPFILFFEDGRVKSLNQEAQYLLGEIDKKTIFELAQSYASHSFGFKTTAIELSFGSFKFYAITVGYLDESEIGIKLYKVAAKKFTDIKEYGQNVNIYTLLDLCISAASTRNQAKFIKEFDPTFPDIRLKIENFTKLLDKVYQSYVNSKNITTTLALQTGEYVKFQDKKYPIFFIKITGEKRDNSIEKEIENKAVNSNAVVRFTKESTIISTAMVST
jgi:hypothetical protein